MRATFGILTAILLALPAGASGERTPQVPPAEVPLPTPRPSALPDGAPTAPATAEPPAPAPRTAACDIPGVFLSPAEQPRARAPDGSETACAIDNPVTIEAVLSLDGTRRIAVAGTPLLSCAYAARFGTFLRTIADPMASGHFGAPIREVRTGPGFQCRYRNRAGGGKVSAHGRGIALDIAGFELTDGRLVAIGAGPAEDRGFVDALRKASCGHFTTVLGPGSDSAHATHLHLDTERHGRSDAYRICQ